MLQEGTLTTEDFYDQEDEQAELWDTQNDAEFNAIEQPPVLVLEALDESLPTEATKTEWQADPITEIVTGYRVAGDIENGAELYLTYKGKEYSLKELSTPDMHEQIDAFAAAAARGEAGEELSNRAPELDRPGQEAYVVSQLAFNEAGEIYTVNHVEYRNLEPFEQSEPDGDSEMTHPTQEEDYESGSGEAFENSHTDAQTIDVQPVVAVETDRSPESDTPPSLEVGSASAEKALFVPSSSQNGAERFTEMITGEVSQSDAWLAARSAEEAMPDTEANPSFEDDQIEYAAKSVSQITTEKAVELEPMTSALASGEIHLTTTPSEGILYEMPKPTEELSVTIARETTVHMELPKEGSAPVEPVDQKLAVVTKIETLPLAKPPVTEKLTEAGSSHYEFRENEISKPLEIAIVGPLPDGPNLLNHQTESKPGKPLHTEQPAVINELTRPEVSQVRVAEIRLPTSPTEPPRTPGAVDRQETHTVTGDTWSQTEQPTMIREIPAEPAVEITYRTSGAETVTRDAQAEKAPEQPQISSEINVRADSVLEGMTNESAREESTTTETLAEKTEFSDMDDEIVTVAESDITDNGVDRALSEEIQEFATLWSQEFGTTPYIFEKPAVIEAAPEILEQESTRTFRQGQGAASSVDWRHSTAYRSIKKAARQTV